LLSLLVGTIRNSCSPIDNRFIVRRLATFSSLGPEEYWIIEKFEWALNISSEYEPLLGSGYPRATIDPSIYDLPHSFFLCEGKQRNFCKTRVILRISDHALKFELPAFLAEYDQGKFDQVVLRLAVLRIEKEVLADTFDAPLSYIDIDVPDFETLRGLADAKSCDYQVREKRDLFCSASSCWVSPSLPKVRSVRSCPVRQWSFFLRLKGAGRA
jgi:hypothetical protein